MDIKYLKVLPYDVLEHICFYLDTVDIIKISELIPEFENVSYSKRLIQNADLFCEYYITKEHINGFLCAKLRRDFITTLNLTSIYWIPAVDIRKCISSLQNLECLFIADTKMGLLKQDMVTYGTIVNLKKLAISVTKRNFCKENLSLFPKVKHLYLHLDSDGDCVAKHIMVVLKKYQCVEELWLVESGTTYYAHLSYVTIPTSVVKLYYLLLNMCISKEITGLENICSNFFTRTQRCMERRDGPTKPFLEFNLNEDWNTYFKLSRNNLPFTLAQAREIIDKESVDNIDFEEINFAHNPIVCGVTYRRTVGNLLLCSNMKPLKKLAVNVCACRYEDDVEENHSTAKRQKCDNKCLLEKILENSPHIDELEIWACLKSEGCSKITNNSCGVIANFKCLRKLTLDSLPLHINGSFLINVFSSCQHLRSLRIKSERQKTSLHNMLCLSLKYAAALKDLRYEHHGNISIDKLFEAITANRNLSLQRLFVECESVEIFTVKPLEKFLEVSTDLKLMYLVIADLPKTVIKPIMKSLEKYRDDPRKILIITEDKKSYSGRLQVPFMHVYDMVLCLTHVSSLDVFNGYV